MSKNQLEILVMYQDIDLMLRDAEQEKGKFGFNIEGKEKLKNALNDLEKKLRPSVLRTYKKLRTRYKHVIVPVQDNVCLGCFAKLPTSYSMVGRKDDRIIKCEQCGRILYWLD
ncbi:MAG: C4-type zinc ribbon domain-containing protein [bacterium]